MTALTLYGLKSCDTCKKALKALAAAGREVTFVDVRDEADLPARVPVWLTAVGPKVLVNRASTTWRGLDDAQKASADADPAPALIANPTLIKRPVIETADGTVLVGWRGEVEAQLTA